MWVIFDLDGTLADIEERRTLASKGNGKINWGIFFDPNNIQLDKPLKKTILLLQSLKAQGYGIAIFSGRGEETRTVTIEWLKQFGVEFDKLIMRPVQDYTPDDVLKQGWLNAEFPNRDQVLCVFDDRNKVVDMWRREGLLCCQVAPGDF
jgi:FMN phosphatase YigB (HAD superfamily)